MSRIKIDYGIDLGTTNSAIVRMESGVPVIKKTDLQSDTMPSCVYFNKKKSISVGMTAFNSYKRDKLSMMKSFDVSESNSFIEFKRTMGTDKTYHSSNMEKDFSSEELSSEILKKLKSFINDEEITSVVITVPAKFNTTQIDATQKAAELAGFSHVELLQEPIAASMAYGLNPDKSDGYWMVFDFGGGTFDVALIRVEDGIIKVVDSEGDNYLGGKDIDYSIVDGLIIPYLKNEYKIDQILNDSGKKTILRDAMKFFAEQVKIQLSFNDSYDILTDLGDIPGSDDEGEEIELDFTITREEFKKVVEPVFQKAIDLSIQLINRNNISSSDLSQVLLVGGPTYSPILRDMIKNQISSNVNTSIDPMTAVASGASLFASTRDIPNNFQKRDKSKLQLELKYDSTSVEMEEFVTVKVLRDQCEGDVPNKLFIEIERTDKGWSSGKTQIENDADLVEVILNPSKSNNFSIKIFDEKGSVLECEPKEFTIIQGSKVGDSTLPNNIGIEIKDVFSGKVGFNIVPVLEKNNSIPCVGKTPPLKTQKQLRPGIKDDYIKIPIYEGEYGSEGTKAIHNTLIKEVIISGEQIPKLLPSGSEVELTFNIDSSRRIKFEAFFPYLDDTVELDIDRTITTIISSENLQTEISKAKNQLEILGEENNSENIQTLKSEVDELKNMLDNGGDDEDNRNKTLEKLRGTLKRIDKEEESLEWPNVEEELRDSLDRLKDTNSKFGNESLKEAISKISQMVEKVIQEQNTKTGRDLIDQIRSLNFKLIDEGAGVALEINIIKGFDDNFNTHDWSNPSEARKLIDSAKSIINSNPTKDKLRSIVIKLYGLLPDVDSSIETNDDSILTN